MLHSRLLLRWALSGCLTLPTDTNAKEVVPTAHTLTLWTLSEIRAGFHLLLQQGDHLPRAAQVLLFWSVLFFPGADGGDGRLGRDAASEGDGSLALPTLRVA